MTKMLEITGTFRNERRRFVNPESGDVIIGTISCNGEINGEVTIKGQADLDELNQGGTYRFYGHWTEYRNRYTQETEKQFAFQTFVQEQPASREGVIQYLKQHGEGNGLGHARAAKLWELFGPDAVKVCREQPAHVVEKLCEHKLKITAEQMDQIAANLAEVQQIEGCTLDIIDLLKGRGFPKSLTKDAIKVWGNRASQIIRRDPYKLMRFKHCGFKKCDELYLDLGLPKTRWKRQALCIWYAIAKGHTWFPIQVAKKYHDENIRTGNSHFERALTLACRAKYLAELRTKNNSGSISHDGNVRWLAEYKKARNETELAAAIATASKEPALWPDVANLPDIDDHQRQELAKATQSAVGMLGGGPGTGKTYTLAALIKALIETVGADNILIGAFTGKAVVRINENLERYGIGIRARTWSSLLLMIEKLGPQVKFPHKVLLGDEASMNSTDLMAGIFRRRSSGTNVLMVGDVNQLPPIEHGAPLRDMIEAGVSYGELTEIKRNSGGIVEACAAIRQSKPWGPGNNLHISEIRTPENQILEMLRLIKFYENQGLDPIWQVQVLVAVNKRSPLARREINRILQTELNSQPGVAGCPFRVGDKIVNTKNGFLISREESSQGDEVTTDDNGRVYVANGELAQVIEVEEKFVVAKLDAPRRIVMIPRGKVSENESPDENAEDKTGTGCDWDLGYALSVHKSQGSEWPVVIALVDPSAGAGMVCDRAWLYTVISRAKDQMHLIGQKHVADTMCRKNKMSQRRTFLREKILLANAIEELGVL